MRSVWLLAALAVTILVSILAATDRDWNFDCLGYAGAARHWLGESREALHEQVYAEVERAPRSAAKALVESSKYRKTLAHDAGAFAA